MRLVICEDSLEDMEHMLDLCEQYAQTKGLDMPILQYGNTDAMLADPEIWSADVFLLDIVMPGPHGNEVAGIRAARTLRETGYNGAIVLTTSSEDYYADGFSVGATHYLVKPLSYESLQEALDRILPWIKRPRRVITVPVNRFQLTIPQDLIHYAEVFGHETLLHTEAEKLRVLLPLSKIEKLLKGDPFLRCYRSYIINMDYVKVMEDTQFIMQNGARIPISLRSRQSLRERYMRHRFSQP